ncbi:hypothetical protein [Paeniglutamicibacter antarcticus]|uniref:Glycosyltransferase involved in cell wall biosynthesis n=1 Tax=Paeniglutamicibacter antarcticus TaxID=494023 RepID=A0ABP9TJI3_9MICC
MLKNLWKYYGKNLIEFSTESPASFHIEVGPGNHGYVVGGRRNGDFSVLPDYSFTDFQPGAGLYVNATVRSIGNVLGQWVIMLYKADGTRTNHWGNDGGVEATTSKDTVRATVAFRVKGIGEIRVTDVEMGAFWSGLTQPIVFSRDVTGARKVAVSAGLFAVDKGEDASALISCQFFDAKRTLVPPNAGTAINPKHGAYHYAMMGVNSNIEPTEYNFDVPPLAETAEVSILPWKGSKSIRIGFVPGISVNFSEVNQTSSPIVLIQAFVEAIDLGQSLIIQHTTAPVLGHPSLLLRPNRLAKEFVDLGAKIIFLPFSRVDGGAMLMDSNTLMVSREHWPILQRIVGTRSGSRNIFICSSFPDNTAIFTSDYLKAKGWHVVYEVRDDMEEFNRVGYSKWFDPMLERRMAQIAHQIITVSPRLSDKMNIISNRNDAITVPNAVADKLIENGIRARGVFAEELRHESRIVGYLGHLTPSWFDWKLVLDSAKLRPEYVFEIIGHGMPENMSLPDNVVFLGPQGHDEFLEIAKRWKVGLIPFKPSTLTFAVDPNKLYEYLAVGLRVVSAQMGSVDSAPATFVYKSADQFIQKLDSAMSMNFDSVTIDIIEKYLVKSNWQSRAKTMLELFKDSARNA